MGSLCVSNRRHGLYDAYRCHWAAIFLCYEWFSYWWYVVRHYQQRSQYFSLGGIYNKTHVEGATALSGLAASALGILPPRTPVQCSQIFDLYPELSVGICGRAVVLRFLVPECRVLVLYRLWILITSCIQLCRANWVYVSASAFHNYTAYRKARIS